MTHAIDITKGELRGEVSAQWAMRSDDERFTSLSELRAQVLTWKDESYTREFEPKSIRFITDAAKPALLQVEIGKHGVFDLSNHTFDQIAALAQAPAQYLRGLPAPLVAANLRYGILANEDQNAKQVPDGPREIRRRAHLMRASDLHPLRPHLRRGRGGRGDEAGR
jgi:hypothetical protein